jgi:hypothetical protein
MTTSATVTPLESKRGARITVADVHAAADALLVNGQKPTNQGVRAKLGRGSPNTIQQYLDDWWALLGQRVMGSPAEPLALPKPVSDLLISVWTTSLREAQHSLQHTLQARETAATSRDDELSTRESALMARERALEESQAVLNEALNGAQRQHADDRDRLKGLDAELAAERRELHAVRTSLEEVREQLKVAHQAVQTHLDARLRDKSDAAAYIAEVESRAHREVDRVRQEIKELRSKAFEREKAQREEIRGLKDELKRATGELGEVQRAYQAMLSNQLRTQVRTAKVPAKRAKRPKASSAARTRGRAAP